MSTPQSTPNNASTKRGKKKPSYRAPKNWRYSKVYSGERPPFEYFDFEKPLRPYPIPSDIKKMMNSRDNLDMNALNPLLEKRYGKRTLSKITNKNYLEHFRALLFIEEVQHLVDIRQYDQKHVSLRMDPDNRYLWKMVVPGLAEKRPSILRGDRVLVRHKGDSSIVYEGYVHFVNLSDIRVSFHKSIPTSGSFSVQFTICRTPLKLMHRAIENRELLDKLFIKPKHPILGKLKGTNLNERQKNLVQRVLAKPETPIILFGPPGTGKTTTVVECAFQVLQQDPKHRILFCAPSNSAADLIAEILIEDFGINSVFRMNSAMRHPKSLNPEWLMDYSDYCDRKSVFRVPSKTDVLSYSIIVSTCTTAGYLTSVGVPKGTFTHIIVDEAAEALEPEVMIPLSLAARDTVVILAGDPCQLGPIVHSPLAIKYNLGISLLERMLNDKRGLVVKLQKTYRAHPKILSPYSKLFYNDELISMVESNEFLFDNPLRFIHISHPEQRDRDSPSWYNVGELDEVVKQLQYLQQCPEYKANKFNNYDIGIIAPYRKQVQRIKQKLHALGEEYSGIMVGTTEQFQGQEKEIIILSTVRSTRNNIPHDDKFKLGFLNNPKRLNVAISRAKSLMIIIGNAEILALDPNWKEIIKYYITEKAFLRKHTSPFKFEWLEEAYVASIQSPDKSSESQSICVDAAWKDYD